MTNDTMKHDGAYGLDDVVNNPNEGGEYVVLPEGEYPFKVVGTETVRWGGSEKMPSCWKKIIKLEIDGGTLGVIQREENIFLHSKCDWVIAAFFASIGFRKSGDPFIITWFDKVVGEKGRLKLVVREYTKKDGTPGKSNNVKEWVPSETVNTPVLPNFDTPSDDAQEDIPF